MRNRERGRERCHLEDAGFELGSTCNELNKTEKASLTQRSDGMKLGNRCREVLDLDLLRVCRISGVDLHQEHGVLDAAAFAHLVIGRKFLGVNNIVWKTRHLSDSHC